MKRYALIGAAGYIAPRHMKAIKETGGEIVAALDPHDSVGILDSYFPDAHFFTEPERFDRHLDKLRRAGTPVDYVTICSPNYLHDAHIRMALRNGADVICEKPLTLTVRNAEALQEIERETGRRVNVILQLRLDPAIIELKQRMKNVKEISLVGVDYITPRGRWYDVSWKGDINKSGGVATNIGVHLFDALAWIFGDVKSAEHDYASARDAAGTIYLERATVDFFIDTYYEIPIRTLVVNDEVINFGQSFTDLHTESYRRILDGNGFTIQDAIPGIHIAEIIRNNA